MPDFGLEHKTNDDSTEKPKPTVDLTILSKIQPRSPARARSIDLAESDKMAEASGFTSREAGPKIEPYIRPKRTKRKPEQLYPISMRAPVSVLQRFIAYAEKYHLSYPLALERLLDESVILENTGER
jgi:hypothetical protein